MRNLANEHATRIEQVEQVTTGERGSKTKRWI